MNLPPIPPESEPSRTAAALRATLGALAKLLLVAAISGATALGVFEWRMRQEQQSATARLEAVRADVQRSQAQLDAKMATIEKAAEGARLLLAQNGATTTLDARLAELDALKLEFHKQRDDIDARFKNVEKSMVEQVAKQGKETAQALAQDLRVKSLLIKAQGEVLLAQVHWSEGNRGLAKDELATAATSLRLALESAADTGRDGIKQALDLADQARSALILEQSSARDSLNLLWHRVSDLLAPAR